MIRVYPARESDRELLVRPYAQRLPNGFLIKKHDDKEKLERFKVELKGMNAVLIDETVKNLEESLV